VSVFGVSGCRTTKLVVSLGRLLLKGLHNVDSVVSMAKWLNDICGAKPNRFFLQGFKKNEAGMIDDDFQNESNVDENFLVELKGCVRDYFEKLEVRV